MAYRVLVAVAGFACRFFFAFSCPLPSADSRNHVGDGAAEIVFFFVLRISPSRLA